MKVKCPRCKSEMEYCEITQETETGMKGHAHEYCDICNFNKRSCCIKVSNYHESVK